MKRLAVIDGKSVFYRAYYAVPPTMSLRDGTPTNAVFGFASIAIEIIKKLEPDYVAVAWDIKGTSISKRKEILPGYKGTRKPAPPDFHAQIPLLRELLDAFGWPLYEVDHYEADDIMGTFAMQATTDGVETFLVSGDYDMCQLIAPMTQVYITKMGGKELMRYDEAAFTEKYKVRVDQFVDYKALVGDTSDNIPGVRKVGPIAAAKLLAQYDDLDGIYAHINELKGAQKTNLEEDKDIAFASREVAKIFTDAPIEVDWQETDINNTNLANVAAILEKFELHSLTKRLPKHMQQAPDQALYFHESDGVQLKEIEWPKTLEIDGPVVLHVVGDELWLATDKKTVTHQPINKIDKNIWRALEMGTVVGYDIKQLYHELDLHKVSVRFDDVHDIRQGAFLIDPLRRDRSLAALVGGELAAPGNHVAGLWQVYEWQQKAFAEIPKVDDIAKRFDFPLTYCLFQIERRGIKIDKKFLANMGKELADEHKKLEQEMYKMAGYEFNIGSPAQLSEVLFTKLQLPTQGIKKGKTGYSTGQSELDKLRGQHPIIELIEKTRELAKLKNTYVDTLPEQTDENDRVHTIFNQDVAPTGRLSSTGPNLQNIPVRTDLGRKIREAFVPEKGKVFVSADYSQFELRLAAVLSGDKELINDFNGDVDIHTKTASEVYHVPMDDVTKLQRRDAKVINFGVLYGMSPHGLSAATGMTFVESKAFIDKYFELRAPIRKYIDATLEKAVTEGYVETYFGRRRPTPDVNSSNFMVREGAKRAAMNMPIQGTEADLMKLAMMKVDEKIGGIGEQILQVHDSILVECEKENAEKIGEILKETMETIAPELPIKLRVDVSTGKNWGEL